MTEKKIQSIRTILVIDDEEQITTSLKNILDNAGFKVITAANGKLAQQLILTESIDLIISDIYMPATQVSGIELLHFVKEKTKIPIILMTGFSSLSEAKDFTLGADGFLVKPFGREDLLKLVETLLGSNLLNGCDTGKESEVRDQDFSKLNIEDFVCGHQIKYDVFIRISETKYVKVAEEGKDLALDRITFYKTKGVRFLYLRKEDFRKYLSFSLNLSQLIKGKSTISKERKMALFKHTADVISEFISSNDLERETFDDARTIIENTISAFSEVDDFYYLIDALCSHSDFLFAHSLGVSLYSVMIAKAVGWKSPSTIFKVSLSGFFHDIGKKEIDPAILSKPRNNWTPAEVKIHETHSSRGQEILGRVPSIPDEILQVVAQHHENCQGTGYPLALIKSKINPVARLIAVADAFCKFAIPCLGQETLPVKEALGRLTILHGSTLDPEFLLALYRVLNVQEIPKQLADSRRV